MRKKNNKVNDSGKTADIAVIPSGAVKSEREIKETFTYYDAENDKSYTVVTLTNSIKIRSTITEVSIMQNDESYLYRNKITDKFSNEDIDIIRMLYTHMDQEMIHYFFESLNRGILEQIASKTFTATNQGHTYSIGIDKAGDILFFMSNYRGFDIYNYYGAECRLFLEDFITYISSKSELEEFIYSLNKETREKYFDMAWVVKKE